MTAFLQRYALAALGILLALALAGLAAQSIRLANERTAHARTITQFAQARTRAADATTAAIAAARTEETRRVTAIAQIAEDHAARAAVAERDARAAGAAAVSLRERAARVAASACPAAEHSAVAASSPAASAPALVLADVLGRADEAAGELAAALDKSYGAGVACERVHGALTP